MPSAENVKILATIVSLLQMLGAFVAFGFFDPRLRATALFATLAVLTGTGTFLGLFVHTRCSTWAVVNHVVFGLGMIGYGLYRSFIRDFQFSSPLEPVEKDAASPPPG